MSKHDTIKRNILAMTRERSFKKAITGWEIARVIDLPSSSPATPCELCGTRFRSGALLRRSGRKTRKAVTIPVGGTCLQTILSGSFRDKAVIARRKMEVNSRLERSYGELLGDAGHWIAWMTEHVPDSLAPLAAQLKILGMVSTDYALNKLIRFHDATRKYPTAALVPMWDGAEKMLPAEITIDQARAWRKGITDKQRTSAIARLSNDYLLKEIEPCVEEFDEWYEAWNRLTAHQRRAVVALDALSGYAGGEESPALRRWIRHLPAAKGTRFPFFVWCEEHGLTLMVEPSETIFNAAEAWAFFEGKQHTIHFSNCRLILQMTEERVAELELEAFWRQPPWFKKQRRPESAMV